LIKIEGYNSGTVGNNLFVDNINIQGIPSNDAPVASFNSSNSTICQDGTVTFTDQSTSNITAWNWSFPGGSPATSNAANPTVTYPTAGSYPVTLEVTNANGTDFTTNANYVIVNPIPVVAVSPVSPVICAGTSVTLVASGANSYSWSNGLGSGSTKTVSPAATTTYTVTGSNGIACEALQTITITVNPIPNLPSIVQNGNELSAQVTGSFTYQWYLNGNELLGETNSSIQISQSGMYSVMITDNNGCSSISSNFNAQLGTVLENTEQQISLYPNPNSGSFTIDLPEGVELSTLKVTDAYGKMINAVQTKSNTGIFVNLPSVAKGVYFVNYQINDRWFTNRIVVQM
jgi:PKD repeat protein